MFAGYVLGVLLGWLAGLLLALSALEDFSNMVDKEFEKLDRIMFGDTEETTREE